MSVYLEFSCGGCDATARSTDRLKRGFRSFSGRSYGIGRVVLLNTVEDVTPEGWMAFDPYTYATYCPDCWKDIQKGIDDDNQELRAHSGS